MNTTEMIEILINAYRISIPDKEKKWLIEMSENHFKRYKDPDIMIQKTYIEIVENYTKYRTINYAVIREASSKLTQ